MPGRMWRGNNATDDGPQRVKPAKWTTGTMKMALMIPQAFLSYSEVHVSTRSFTNLAAVAAYGTSGEEAASRTHVTCLSCTTM